MHIGEQEKVNVKRYDLTTHGNSLMVVKYHKSTCWVFRCLFFDFFSWKTSLASTRKTLNKNVIFSYFHFSVFMWLNPGPRIQETQITYFFLYSITWGDIWLFVLSTTESPTASEFAPVFTCISRVRVLHVVELHVFTILVSCCDVLYEFCMQHNFHIRWCSCLWPVARWMSFTDQDLLRRA